MDTHIFKIIFGRQRMDIKVEADSDEEPQFRGALMDWSSMANALPSMHTDVAQVTSTARLMVGRTGMRSYRKCKAKRHGARIKHGRIRQASKKPSISRLLRQNDRLRRMVKRLKKKVRKARR